MDTKHNIKPAGGAYKFISSFKNLIKSYFKLITAFLLIKRIKNDEFMNINEQTWGLFPSFAMEPMNMRFLNELRVLQVHCKFIGIHCFSLIKKGFSKMKELGLQWLMDKDISFEENVVRAIRRHRVRYGTEATMANANPEDLKEPVKVDSLVITPHVSCLKGCLFVGRRF